MQREQGFYDENGFCPNQGPQNSELPTVVQTINQVNPVHQQPQPQRDVTPRSVLQDDTGELVKVLAAAISANRLPIPERTIFSGDPPKLNHWKSSFQTLRGKIYQLQRKSSSFRNMLEEQP